MGSISKVNSLKSAGGSVLYLNSLKATGMNAGQIADELKYDNKSNVFFTNDISVNGLLKIYSYIN